MKGIVLAGGTGSRLHPLTKGISKHLLPIYDKPMIYYSLSVLMMAGISEILIITTIEDHNSYVRLLGNGEQFGVNLQYAIQPKPEGLAHAFIIGEEFIGNQNVSLILGDNIFFGHEFKSKLRETVFRQSGATVFGYQVKDPERFGVINFDENMCPLKIEEKPKNPQSNYAVTGLYFYDSQVVDFAKKVRPSERNELEITSINQFYLEANLLHVELLGPDFSWFDTGTYESLLDASLFVRTIEDQQGLKIGCLEEIAYQNNWISKQHLTDYAKKLNKNSYADYLHKLIEQ